MSGTETLFLKGTSRGTFAVPREWTDRAELSPYSQPSVLEFHSLLKLTEILEDVLKKGLDS